MNKGENKIVKNYLHNTLGLTKEYLQERFVDILDSWLDKRIKEFLNGSEIGYLVERKVQELVERELGLPSDTKDREQTIAIHSIFNLQTPKKLEEVVSRMAEKHVKTIVNEQLKNLKITLVLHEEIASENTEK